MPPLRLTESQMARIADASCNLRPRDRGRFLEIIADRLGALTDPGDGDVNSVIRAAMALIEAQRARWFRP
jgi:hypothetical protein